MTMPTRWDPFSELRSTMDRLFEGGFSRPWRLLAGEEGMDFAVEIAETETELEIKASLPGVKPEDLAISVQNDVLTINGEHKEESEETKKDYHRRELRYGSFRRSFALPASIDVDRATAEFEHGILRLKLPKAAAAKAREIKVGGSNAQQPLSRGLDFLKEGEVVGASNCLCGQRIISRPMQEKVVCPQCGRTVRLPAWTVPVNMAVTTQMALVGA